MVVFRRGSRTGRPSGAVGRAAGGARRGAPPERGGSGDGGRRPGGEGGKGAVGPGLGGWGGAVRRRGGGLVRGPRAGFGPGAAFPCPGAGPAVVTCPAAC